MQINENHVEIFKYIYKHASCDHLFDQYSELVSVYIDFNLLSRELPISPQVIGKLTEALANPKIGLIRYVDTNAKTLNFNYCAVTRKGFDFYQEVILSNQTKKAAARKKAAKKTVAKKTVAKKTVTKNTVAKKEVAEKPVSPDPVDTPGEAATDVQAAPKKQRLSIEEKAEKRLEAIRQEAAEKLKIEEEKIRLEAEERAKKAEEKARKRIEVRMQKAEEKAKEREQKAREREEERAQRRLKKAEEREQEKIRRAEARKAAIVIQNGVRRPARKGVVTQIWNSLDAMYTTLGDKAPKRADIFEEYKELIEAKKLSETTLSSQYGYWCKFMGLSVSAEERAERKRLRAEKIEARKKENAEKRANMRETIKEFKERQKKEFLQFKRDLRIKEAEEVHEAKQADLPID